MRQDPLFLLWLVKGFSAEEMDRLQLELARDTHLDTTFVDAIHACPDGTPTLQQETHRLGDYFVSIRVLPPAQPGPVFHLLFQRRPDAGRFWKDLMARVLQGIRHSRPSTTVTLACQGDEEPIVVRFDR
jgi:hypothetical protein